MAQKNATKTPSKVTPRTKPPTIEANTSMNSKARVEIDAQTKSDSSPNDQNTIFESKSQSTKALTNFTESSPKLLRPSIIFNPLIRGPVHTKPPTNFTQSLSDFLRWSTDFSPVHRLIHSETPTNLTKSLPDALLRSNLFSPSI
jgi:hypothetical protein